MNFNRCITDLTYAMLCIVYANSFKTTAFQYVVSKKHSIPLLFFLSCSFMAFWWKYIDDSHTFPSSLLVRCLCTHVIRVCLFAFSENVLMALLFIISLRSFNSGFPSFRCSNSSSNAINLWRKKTKKSFFCDCYRCSRHVHNSVVWGYSGAVIIPDKRKMLLIVIWMLMLVIKWY